MPYTASIGHNGTGWMGTLEPQPRCRGMRWGRRTMAGNGLQHKDGFQSCTWEWDYLTLANFGTIMAQLGLGEGTPSAEVTVTTTRNMTRAFGTYNATVLFPEMPDTSGSFEYTVFRGIKVELVRLEEL